MQKMNLTCFAKLMGSICLAVSIVSCISVKDDDLQRTESMMDTGQYGEMESHGMGQTDRLQGQDAMQTAPANQSYYFGFDNSNLVEGDYDSIAAQAAYLAKHAKARVRLEGNTDERGSREYNLGLGERRARAVSELLQLQGVSQSQIILVSNGREKPVALGHNEESYRINRRVDLVFEAY